MVFVSQTTKRALEASLKKLLLQKPLNKITINDITEDCGVNRMTFYYHFKDIYDRVEWSCLEDARKALEAGAVCIVTERPLGLPGEVQVASGRKAYAQLCQNFFGRPADKKRKLYNGMIKCDAFMYGR